MKKLLTTVLMIFSIWAYSQTDIAANAVNSATRSISISASTYPNPAYNGKVNISIHGVDKVGIVSFYSLSGKKIGEIELQKANNTVLRSANGLVFYQYQNSLGQRTQGKIISFSDNLAVSVENFPAENMLAGVGVLKSYVVGTKPIISALDGLSLGVDGGSIELNSAKMNWNLVDYDATYSYIINPADGTKIYTNDDGSLIFKSASFTFSRVRWEQIPAGENQYYLKNNNTGKYLTNDGGGNVSCTSTTQNTASKWSFETVVVPTEAYVRFTSPLNGAQIPYGTNVIVNTDAFHPDGINLVKVLVDGVYHSRDLTAPYTFTIAGLSAGNHTLKLWLLDNLGNWIGSDVFTIEITSGIPTVGDPTCTITSPANGATLSPGNITVNATATDNGSIANVKFSINGYLVKQDNTSPYSCVFNNLEGGTYTITAVAEDNDGNTTTDNITFTVTPQLLSGQYNFIRLNHNKAIMDKQMFKDAGANRNIRDASEYEWDNMNGPCVIRIPDWIDTTHRADPDAVYYMYFGHHHGQCIRMAWAKNIEGPWTLYNMGAEVATDEKGVLAFDNGGSIARDDQRIALDNNLSVYDHMSSPEILVDDVNHKIIMYFHAFPLYNGVRGDDQITFAASSQYGLSFKENIGSVIQSESYLSVFKYEGALYGLNSSGSMFRHPDPDNNLLEPASGIGFDYSQDRYWEQAPVRAVQWREGLEGGSYPYTRHIKNCVIGDILYATYSATLGVPERLFYVTVDLSDGDWQDWHQEPSFNDPALYNLAKAEAGWEGGQFPVVASAPSAMDEGVNQLRDPFMFKDNDGQLYLFYSGQGEDAIGVARLQWKN